MRVVICGVGVIGACAAYFLRRHGIDVIVVERTEVAAAASGKAGGFLARDWCAGTPLDARARARCSFARPAPASRLDLVEFRREVRLDRRPGARSRRAPLARLETATELADRDLE
jgi:glycine/D-amino acid oxidase-like deaminating enzyme